MLGTSGNFSAVVTRTPLQLVMTASAAHKGTPARQRVLAVDGDGRAVGPSSKRPSAETRLHLEIVRPGAPAAVLHTHSVWGTILSDLHAHARGLTIHGYEMLKGLEGVTTHEHREWMPIVENDQDMTRLAGTVRARLDEQPAAHASCCAGTASTRGGADVGDAERHVEILEFLLEAIGRRS